MNKPENEENMGIKKALGFLGIAFVASFLGLAAIASTIYFLKIMFW